jgi:hypothetical protein
MAWAALASMLWLNSVSVAEPDASPLIAPKPGAKKTSQPARAKYWQDISLDLNDRLLEPAFVDFQTLIRDRPRFSPWEERTTSPSAAPLGARPQPETR